MKPLLLALAIALFCTSWICAQQSTYLPWEKVGGPPCPVNDLVLHHGMLYAATDCGLYKRPENGGIWEQQAGTPDSVALFVAANEQAVVAVFNQEEWHFSYTYNLLHVFTSLDDGVSFERRYTYDYNYFDPFNPHGPAPDSLSRLYAFGDSTFILTGKKCPMGCAYLHFASTDNGRHWIKGNNTAYNQPLGLLNPYTMQGDTVVSFNYDSLRFAQTSNLHPLFAHKIPVQEYKAAGLTWVDNRVAVTFQNGHYAYTDNYGQQWHTDSLALSGVHDFFYSGNYYYWCTDAGFYRSVSIGPANLETLYTHSGPLGKISKAWRGTNGWYLMANAIITWLPDGASETSSVATDGMSPADGVLNCLADRLMFRNERGIWWRSTNGNSWTLEEDEFIYNRRIQKFYTGDTFQLAVGQVAASVSDRTLVYRSTDGGQHWSLPTDFGYSSDYISEVPFIENSLDNRLYYSGKFTADDGLTWQDFNNAYGLTAALGDTLLSIYRGISFDHGQNWHGMGNEVYHLAGSVLYNFPNTSGFIYRSFDFGMTWEEVALREFHNGYLNPAITYLIGDRTWLQDGENVVFFTPEGQQYFTLLEAPFGKGKFRLSSNPVLDFGRIVQKDSTLYAARRRGVWRTPSCYVEHPELVNLVDTTLCVGQSIAFYGDTLQADGLYVHRSSESVCDTLHVLQLKVRQIGSNWYASICENDTLYWNGQAYYSQGQHIQHLSTSAGCDSMVILHLNINDVPDSIFIVQHICEGASYHLANHTFTQAGEYWFSTPTVPCPTRYHLQLTVIPDIVELADTTVATGSILYGHFIDGDTTFTIVLNSALNCDRSLILTVHTIVDINELGQLSSIQAYPNPFRDQLHLRWFGNELMQLQLYDAHGQLCQEAECAGPVANLDTRSLPPGFYRLEIRSGEQTIIRKLVKMF